MRLNRYRQTWLNQPSNQWRFATGDGEGGGEGDQGGGAGEGDQGAGGEGSGGEGGSLLPNLQKDESGNVVLTEGQWLVSDSVLGTGDKPEFMLEKFKTLDAQAKGYSELEKQFGAFTGAPEEYKLNVPEGVEGEFDMEDPMLKAGMEFAKANNMNQEGFDQMVGMFINGQVADQALAKDAEIEALGTNADQRINTVNQFLQNNMEADVYKEIQPLVNSADSVKLLEAVINATAPRVAPIDGGSNPDGFTKAGLAAMREIRVEGGPNDGKLKWHVDSEYRKEVEAYSKNLHGEG